MCVCVCVCGPGTEPWGTPKSSPLGADVLYSKSHKSVSLFDYRVLSLSLIIIVPVYLPKSSWTGGQPPFSPKKSVMWFAGLIHRFVVDVITADTLHSSSISHAYKNVDLSVCRPLFSSHNCSCLGLIQLNCFSNDWHVLTRWHVAATSSWYPWLHGVPGLTWIIILVGIFGSVIFILSSGHPG